MKIDIKAVKKEIEYGLRPNRYRCCWRCKNSESYSNSYYKCKKYCFRVGGYCGCKHFNKIDVMALKTEIGYERRGLQSCDVCWMCGFSREVQTARSIVFGKKNNYLKCAQFGLRVGNTCGCKHFEKRW